MEQGAGSGAQGAGSRRELHDSVRARGGGTICTCAIPRRLHHSRRERVAQPARLRRARRTKASVRPEAATERSNQAQPAGLCPARRTKASVRPEAATERSNQAQPAGLCPARRTKASVRPKAATERSNQFRPEAATERSNQFRPKAATERSGGSAQGSGSPQGVARFDACAGLRDDLQACDSEAPASFAKRTRGSARGALPRAAYESECAAEGRYGALKPGSARPAPPGAAYESECAAEGRYGALKPVPAGGRYGALKPVPAEGRYGALRGQRSGLRESAGGCTIRCVRGVAGRSASV